jgi:flagellar hook assembly protein FlgD
MDREHARRGRRVAREGKRDEEHQREQAFHACKDSIRVSGAGVEPRPRVVHGLRGVPKIRLLIAALLLALAAPAAAAAGLVSMRAQDVPLAPGRTLQAATHPGRFDMLGLRWIGAGSVDYRTRAVRGSWGPWRRADSDNRSGAWHDGDLDWIGPTRDVQFRVHGRIRRLRSYELQSRVLAAPVRATATAGSPAIVSRSAWHANEEIVRAHPLIASSIRLAIVHHTAGTNSYTRAEAPAIVRGIEVYHVLGNGWNDIGYNFLIDRFGTVYEGRGGGIDRNVIGAHAQGFNVGTVGVALIGDYNTATPTIAQQNALVHLLAWRLDVAHLDPLSRVLYTSGGNYKFHAGRVVTLRAISGHRDTGPTECPGARAYALLPAIAQRVAVTGLPKLYAPEVAGVLGGSLRFRARLSAALPWTVTVTNAAGAVVASGAGRGTLVDWTWASSVSGGPFTWVIAASGVRSATGTLGTRGAPPPPPVLRLTGLASLPAVLAPAADGSGAAATATFTLGSPARVTARVLDASGAPVATVLDEVRPAGLDSFAWSAAALPDGRYLLSVTASAVGKSVRKTTPVVVDRTLTALQASALDISPNGDGVLDTTTATFTLSQPVPLTVQVTSQGAVVATLFDGTLGPGPQSLTWDGTSGGVRLPEGSYELAFTVDDALGPVTQTLPVTLDVTPPTLTVVDPKKLVFSLDEPATVTVVVDGQTKIVTGEPAGTFTISVGVPVTSFTAQAQDFAGNSSPVVSG